MYSQNLEERVIRNYFGDFKGHLLDIGCNDGVTFSNSRRLILDGWSADLVDASQEVLVKCSSLYLNNNSVRFHNCAIYTEDGMGILHESGAHVPNGKDYSLVSTVIPEEKKRWGNVVFKEVDVPFICFDTFKKISYSQTFDFISLDVEGVEWDILQQIDLTAVGCKCLCIEWNNKPEMALLFKSYCSKFGLREIHRNSENIIFAV